MLYALPPQNNNDWKWTNCTEKYPEIVTSVKDLELKLAIEAYIGSGSRIYFSSVQAAFVPVGWYVSLLLFNLLRLSMDDMLRLRISAAELILGVSYVGAIVMTFIGTSHQMRPMHDTPADFYRSEFLMMFTYFIFWSSTIVSTFFLFRQSYRVMILEVNGENVKKYTLPQLIIHRRSQGHLKEKYVTRNKTLSKREVHAISVSEYNRQSVKKTVHKR